MKRHLPIRLARTGLAALLPLLFIAPHARADADDTINVTLGLTEQHDSNLFRLSSSVNPGAIPGIVSKSDNITVTSLGLKLNKRYSLQRFELETSLVDYRYQNNTSLSFTGRNHAAAWRWSVTPYLHGNLSSDRKETQNNFADVTGNFGARNLRTDENNRFDAVLEASGSWRLLGGVARSTRTNGQVVIEESDNRLDTAEAGVRYVYRSGSSLSYIAKTGRGEYFNRAAPLTASLLDNRFDHRENEARLTWPITGKTTIDARAAHIARTHPNFGQRDFSGPVGHVNVIWNVTGKTSLTASLAHDLSAYQDQTASYISTNRFSLSPLWQVSAKTALRGRYDYARREYRGAVAVTPFNDRFDTLQSAMISYDWQALRSLSLSTSLQNDRRSSTVPGVDFESTTVGITGQATF